MGYISVIITHPEEPLVRSYPWRVGAAAEPAVSAGSSAAAASAAVAAVLRSVWHLTFYFLKQIAQTFTIVLYI